MKAIGSSGGALTFAACLLGCATPPTSSVPPAVVSPQQGGVIAPERAEATVVIGKSSKADVIAALGETLAIRFDSGYEVWVYRLAGEKNKATRDAGGEFVILFAPSGVVAKTRIRPAPQPTP